MATAMVSDEDGVSESDGDKSAVSKHSYANRLKSNINYNQRLQRSVLEITLERVNKNNDIEINDTEIERVLRTLGIDIRSQVEGYQLQYKGATSIISVWMPVGVNLENYCKDMVIRVDSNVTTGMIRPAGKTEVTVTIVGLDFNTPDTFVIEYLNKFGTVTNQSVIYSEYNDGPFKGKKNGERRYQVDFGSSKMHMGTYHIIDNCKVRVFYRGNRKTCGRCHQLADKCIGGGLAKNCEAGGGVRLPLAIHMEALWKEIGFKPTNFILDTDNLDNETDQPQLVDVPIMTNSKFPATFSRQEPCEEDFKKCDGITVKNIPKNVEEKMIWELLVDNGLPLEHGIENIRINMGEKNSWAIIDGLQPEEIKDIYDSLHFPVTNKKFFDAPIYCKPLRLHTPTKSTELSLTNNSQMNLVGDIGKSNSINEHKDQSNKPGLTKSQPKRQPKKLGREQKKKKLKGIPSQNKLS